MLLLALVSSDCWVGLLGVYFYFSILSVELNPPNSVKLTINTELNGTLPTTILSFC